MKLLSAYMNGNVKVGIFDNGTKIRTTEDDEFNPAFAENIDVKITNRCYNNCPYCHEGSTSYGTHADIMNQEWVDSLHAYQEVAIGGGDPTEHPDLIPFLQKLKDMNVIANMTVNQKDFTEKYGFIKWLYDEHLINGLGVSYSGKDENFLSKISGMDRAVIHVISGVFTQSDWADVFKPIAGQTKMLILGYKRIRRGMVYVNDSDSYCNYLKNQKWLAENLKELREELKVLSFDNLAIEQLAIKSMLSPTEWDEMYNGDDGSHTFYIDAVKGKFAKSSIESYYKRYDLMSNVDSMFETIKC